MGFPAESSCHRGEFFRNPLPSSVLFKTVSTRIWDDGARFYEDLSEKVVLEAFVRPSVFYGKCFRGSPSRRFECCGHVPAGR